MTRDALGTGSPFPGIVFTSDRSLPRSRGSIGVFVQLLDVLMGEHPADEAFAGRVHWLAPG